MKKYSDYITIFLLAAVVWGSRYYYSANFGIYEDDQHRVPRGMSWTWAEFWSYVQKLPEAQLNMEEQGRMLHPAFIQGFSFLGQQLGGLEFIYLLGYCIVLVNTLLFYFLLKRLSNQPFFAVTGALAFAVFPADTTQAFLTHSLGIQPSLTFLLISFHLYVSRNKYVKFTSYIFAFLILLCYERFFLMFLAAPLLKDAWDKKLKWTLLRHTFISSAIIFLIALARRLQGESRVSELGFSFLWKVFSDTLLGPIVGIGAFLYRPITGLLSFQKEWFTPTFLFFLAIAYVLFQTKNLGNSTLRNLPESPDKQQFFQNIAKWAVTGTIMLGLSYPLTAHGSVFILSGRASRVHAAAVVGGSILVACACSLLAFFATKKRKQKWMSLGLAAFFSLLLTFGFTVQADYMMAWQYQRAFWTDVIELCPDMTKGTVILVNPNIFREPEQIRANSRHHNWIVRSIYQFPEDWGLYQHPSQLFTTGNRSVQQPVFFLTRNRWKERLTADGPTGNILRLPTEAVFPLTGAVLSWGNDGWPQARLDSSQAIVLEVRNGSLVRREEPLQVDGRSFPLKQNNSTLTRPDIKPGFLYRSVIRNSDELPIDYLR